MVQKTGGPSGNNTVTIAKLSFDDLGRVSKAEKKVGTSTNTPVPLSDYLLPGVYCAATWHSKKWGQCTGAYSVDKVHV
jgi:hypothetical protein